MMSENKNMMTAEGIQKLQEKLDYYLKVKRPEIAKRIQAARELGDLSENAEYDEAKRDQAEMEVEILKMQKQLEDAVVIDDSMLPNDEVRVGSKIRVKDVQTKEEFVFDIIGSSEADPLNGKISNLSPIGSALLHKKKGATVKINTPGGVLSYKLMEILPKD
ncbi:MAG: transcription elongation factor GreA [Clostridia bacterium]|nr:transcription elongation factor GreA [Clostridia bacterium]